MMDYSLRGTSNGIFYAAYSLRIANHNHNHFSGAEMGE